MSDVILPRIEIGARSIGPAFPPLVIAELGINHGGDFLKAIQLIDAAAAAGCETVKFQAHIAAEEMIESDLRPGNSDESLWEIIERCSFTEEQEAQLKDYVEAKGMYFLSTPFSRAAVDRLERLGVLAFKVGSGECNNLPLIDYIAKRGKPMLVSTGMNDLASISRTVAIIRSYKTPFALLHCTSIYPTPPEKVRLGALQELQRTFSDAVIGFSDHSQSIYPALGSIALGARIIEKHFTGSKDWEGPDIQVSMDPAELKALVAGSLLIFSALGGSKTILAEEQDTIRFAYASITALRDINADETFSYDNIGLKRPGLGDLRADEFEITIGRSAKGAIAKNEQLRRQQISD